MSLGEELGIVSTGIIGNSRLDFEALSVEGFTGTAVDSSGLDVEVVC